MKINVKTVQIVSIIVTIIIAIFIIATLFIINSPKNLYLTQINRLVNNISSISFNNTNLKSFLNENNSILLKSNIDINNSTSKYLVETLYHENKIDKINKLNSESYLNNKINTNFSFVEENNIFNYLFNDEDNTFDKEYSAILDLIRDDSYKHILTEMSFALKDVIKEEDIHKVKTIIKIDNRNIRTTRLSYKVDDKVLNDYFEILENKLINNRNIIDILIKYFNMSDEASKNFITNYIKNIKSNIKPFSFYLNFYIEGSNKIVKSELTINTNYVTLVEMDNTLKIEFFKDNKQFSNISIIKGTKNYIVEGFIDKETINGFIRTNNNKFEVDIDLNNHNKLFIFVDYEKTDNSVYEKIEFIYKEQELLINNVYTVAD